MLFCLSCPKLSRTSSSPALRKEAATVYVNANFTYNFVLINLSLMPWIRLGRPQQLFVAQAADVILYQKSKRAKSQSSWQPLMTFSDHQGDVSKFVIIDGHLVSCGMDKSIRTWSLKTGLCDGLYLGHSSDVHSVDGFGEVIVTGSRDKTVKVQCPNLCFDYCESFLIN